MSLELNTAKSKVYNSAFPFSLRFFLYLFSKHFVLAMNLASAKFFAATFWVVPEKTKEADPPAVTVVQKPLALTCPAYRYPVSGPNRPSGPN